MSHVRVLKVLQILDKRTLVIGGAPGDLEYLSIDLGLSVLSPPGPMVPEVNVPLVVPKADIVVTANLGHYVIAKSDVETEERPMFLSLHLREQHKYRPNLNVRESQAIGNPGSSEIAVGDVVIPTQELPAYIKQLAEQASKQP